VVERIDDRVNLLTGSKDTPVHDTDVRGK